MDKGVALVVLDKEDYIKKAEDLLEDNTYKKIAEDPTPKQKNKLISILRNIKAEGGLIISNRCWVSKILWAAKNL